MASTCRLVTVFLCFFPAECGEQKWGSSLAMWYMPVSLLWTCQVALLLGDCRSLEGSGRLTLSWTLLRAWVKGGSRRLGINMKGVDFLLNAFNLCKYSKNLKISAHLFFNAVWLNAWLNSVPFHLFKFFSLKLSALSQISKIMWNACWAKRTVVRMSTLYSDDIDQKMLVKFVRMKGTGIYWWSLVTYLDWRET